MSPEPLQYCTGLCPYCCWCLSRLPRNRSHRFQHLARSRPVVTKVLNQMDRKPSHIRLHTREKIQQKGTKCRRGGMHFTIRPAAVYMLLQPELHVHSPHPTTASRPVPFTPSINECVPTTLRKCSFRCVGVHSSGGQCALRMPTRRHAGRTDQETNSHY